jgi:hypothetical protein
MNLNLLKIFNPKYEIHAGLSLDGDIYHYILIAKAKGVKPYILFKQKGNIQNFRLHNLFPLHADLNNVPVYLLHEIISEIDAEEWIDANEELIIPKGLSSNEIMNEWCVEKDEIYSGTVLKKSFDEYLNRLHAGNSMISSISIPLWDIARLYGQYVDAPFILWKLSSDQSILGYVENGRLNKLCNFWAGIDDIKNDYENVKVQLHNIAKSLANFSEKIRIISVNDSKYSLPVEFFNDGCIEFLKTPEINELLDEYHESYSLADHEETTLDFAPVENSMQARSFTVSRKKSLSFVRASITAILVAIVILCGLKALTRIADSYIDGRMEPVKEHLFVYNEQKSRMEKISRDIRLKSGFIAMKSRLTIPVTEMQAAFPEGIRAEEISLSEKDLSDWDLTILAFSESSSLIPDLIKNISEIRGMSGLRMIYSEQEALQKKSGAREIKFKLEGNWKK